MTRQSKNSLLSANNLTQQLKEEIKEPSDAAIRLNNKSEQISKFKRGDRIEYYNQAATIHLVKGRVKRGSTYGQMNYIICFDEPTTLAWPYTTRYRNANGIRKDKSYANVLECQLQLLEDEKNENNRSSL